MARNSIIEYPSGRQPRRPEMLVWTELETPIGWASIATSSQAVYALILSDRSDTRAKALQGILAGITIRAAAGAPAQQGKAWINRAVGRLTDDTLEPLPLALSGSPFELETWRSIALIPPGETWSYQQLANHMNRPRAVRAVASACGRNRHALLIPCHRVVRSDGTLGGYRWQLERKARLLALEQALARPSIDGSSLKMPRP